MNEDPPAPAAGDGSATDAFADLLVAELPRLVRLATRLVRDADQAEDCAQETIVGAWRRRDQLRDPAALSAWLRRSLVNRVIDRSRVHRDELDIEAVEANWRDDHYSVAPERVLERAELRDELEDALARLPVIYRVPVVLHDVVGWTAADIGRAMDAGLPATKQRLRRGRMMLVSALAEGDERRLASLAQPLRCWRARRHVSAYLDGELDAGDPVGRRGAPRDLPDLPAAVRRPRGRHGEPRRAARSGHRRRGGDRRAHPAAARRAAGAGTPVSEGPSGTGPTPAERWDARHAAQDPIESADADPTLVEVAATLTPAAALDLGAGDGRNAMWLATHGWRVTAVDFSVIALDRGRAVAAGAGVDIDWRQEDLLAWTPPAASFDLVTLAFIHLPSDERRRVYAAAADAVAPGGTLLVVGHDRSNLDGGAGGPKDPDVLFTPADVVRDLGPAFRVVRADTVRRRGAPEPAPIDAVVVALRQVP